MTGAANAQSFSDIYGRNLVSDRGTIVIRANGTMGGTFDGQDFQGRWWTEGGNFCREGSVGGTSFPAACQTIGMGNGTVSFTTIGSNRTNTYQIE